jgi:hypothetical protein
MTRTYFVYADDQKHPRPIRELIAEAVAACRAKYPGKRPDMLLMHPVHLAEIGTWTELGGRMWMCQYRDVIDPRQVRVGPVD